MTAMAHSRSRRRKSFWRASWPWTRRKASGAELIEGEIVVTPPPDGDHEDYIGLIVDQVARRARTRMQFSGNKGLKLRSGGGCPKTTPSPTAPSPLLT
ncbi:Putative restriction endonuclease domain-containing protein OS=Streptomyces microflavus OX=1919 GN=Smic_20670 PE=4 SV=1 [Streptomyces microflavus]